MGAKERGTEKRRVFWVNTTWILIPLCLAFVFVAVGLLTQGRLDPRAETWLWVVMGLIVVLTGWLCVRKLGRIIVTDEGLEEITARGRRFFAWEELRRIRDETGSWGRDQRRRFDVRAQGGRRLTFWADAIWNAEGLASLIEDRIRAHRPPVNGPEPCTEAADDGIAPGAVGLGRLVSPPRRHGRLRRGVKRYRDQSAAAQLVEVLVALALAAAALWASSLFD